MNAKEPELTKLSKIIAKGKWRFVFSNFTTIWLVFYGLGISIWDFISPPPSHQHPTISYLIVRFGVFLILGIVAGLWLWTRFKKRYDRLKTNENGSVAVPQ